MAIKKAEKATKKPNKKEKKGSYGAESISVLEGLEPVRKRPGMYIGTTGPEGLHHMIWEIFDNGRDEAMGGFADHIEVALLPNNRIRVADNGRGIPVDIHKKTKVSALETIMTTLHAGGKFGGDGYAKATGGLHGVGASVVNALSEYTKVEVHRDGGKHMQEYSKGKKKAKVKKVGASKLHGTIVTFEADDTIFEEVKFNADKIINHLRQQAYLIKGSRVSVIDAREYTGKIDADNAFYLMELGLEVPSKTFYFEGGLLSLVKHFNENQKAIHKHVFYTDKESGEVSVEVAFQYVDDISPRLVTFANNTSTPEGGMHLTGFKTALTRGLNSYARKAKILKDGDDNLTGDDVLEGITAVVSVKLKEIQFEGQTKAKLGSVEARGAVETIFGEALGEFLEENPDDGKAVVNKVLLALKARKAAKAAKESVLRKGALEGMALPGKLSDCQSRSAELSEIFIVEGDSAGGTAKTGRDRKTQAILPLRGKILNVERARLDRMLGSEQIKNIVVALGTAIGDTFNIEKLRYHKIIIATDADVDGSHIDTLLLTLFFRYFRPIIDGGFLYIAQPPLYKIKKGKELTYVYTEEEKEKLIGKDEIAEIGEDEEVEEGEEEVKIKKAPKISIQRYKGLGEMNADELWETTMDPERRVLKQVTIEDAEDANKTFDMLMGTDVPSRKSFIQTHAKLANIDI
ncbi:DNA topoisomerase subunit B [Patescibacteria group bacterium]